MDLTLSTRSAGERLVVSVAGEIDVYTAPQLRQQLITAIVAGTYKIIVDLTEVTFLDSTGLGVFMGALKRIKAHDGTLELVISREIVLKIFQITGLTKVFAIHSTLEAALAVEAN